MIFTNFSGDCLQRYHFYDNTHFSLGKSGQGGKGALRLTLWKAPTRETRPDHYTGNSVPYSLRQVRRFFNVPCWPYNTEDAGDGAYDLSSLSEKTGTSNHLQMSLQRHHVLLSWLSGLGLEPETFRTAVRRSTNWANWCCQEKLLKCDSLLKHVKSVSLCSHILSLTTTSLCHYNSNSLSH